MKEASNNQQATEPMKKRFTKTSKINKIEFIKTYTILS